MRSAISPRLAIRTLLKITLTPVDFEKHLPVLYGLPIASGDADDTSATTTAHGIANAKGFHKRKLPVSFKQIAGDGRRPT